MPEADLEIERSIRVAVVGGGPAGAFFTIRFLSLARERGLSARVTVFEPKSFEKGGAPNCNYCQGVVSAGLVAQLETLGLTLPRRVIQREIHCYRLVTSAGSLCLEAPDGRNIYTVYRGHGPNPAEPGKLSFDQFLLDSAVSFGARQVTARVTSVRIDKQAVDPVVLTDSNGETHIADIVIGAFGVNSQVVRDFERLGFGYQRPQTHAAVLAEYPIQEGHGRDDEIVVYVPGQRPVQFGVITPKRGYLTVSLIGKGLGQRELTEFMREAPLDYVPKEPLSAVSPHCQCAPRFPVRPARRLAASHCLIVGDAGIARYYKKGIDSALRSATLAAEVLAECGPVNEKELCRRYERRIKREFELDNYVGQFLFRVFEMINRSAALTLAQLRLARGECPSGLGKRKLRWILWNMFTGDAPYRLILFRCLDPVLILSTLCSALRAILSGEAKRIKRGKFGR